MINNSIEIQKFPLWDKLTAKGSPLSFDIEITARCNMNCAHCYINLPAGDRQAQSNELSVERILSIAREAVDIGAVWCLITGGEPLLRNDFTEIYMGLKRLGLLVSVFTNATLIHEEHIALFKKYPPRDIEITVYGVTKKTFEAVTRRPGSFEMFKNGINALVKNNVRIRLKSMAMQANYHEQQAIADFCLARTKDFFRFDPQLHLRYDGNHKRNEEIRTQRLTPEQIIAMENSDDRRMNIMRKECDILINRDFAHDVSDHIFHCGAGNGSFNISFDGHFRLCSSLCAKGTMYNLYNGTLKDAYENFVPQVRNLRSKRKEFLESCLKCACVNICLWCPAHAHLETGVLDGSVPYFCEVAHRRAENLKKKI